MINRRYIELKTVNKVNDTVTPSIVDFENPFRVTRPRLITIVIVYELKVIIS